MMTRRILLGAAFTALAVLFAIAIHSPPARSAVRSWAVARISSSSGIRATISRLDYNLLTLSVNAGGVALTADGSRTPFFSAEELRLNLPWTIVRGPIAVESLEVENPSLVIVREADGQLNLPRGSATTTDSFSGPLDIRRFIVRGLRVRYDDRSAGVLVTASDIGIALEQTIEGRLSGPMPLTSVSVTVDERQTHLSTRGGRLAFDGQALALEHIVLDAPEGRAEIAGKLTLLPGFDLTALQYAGHLDLARVTPWIGLDGAPTGLVSFSGTAAGRLDTISTTIDAAGDRLNWPNVGPLSVSARTVLTGSGAEIESLRVTAAGGELAGRARVPFDERAIGSATLNWQSLRLSTIVSAFVDAAICPAIRVRCGRIGRVELDGTRVPRRTRHDREQPGCDASFAWRRSAVGQRHAEARRRPVAALTRAPDRQCGRDNGTFAGADRCKDAGILDLERTGRAPRQRSGRCRRARA